MNVDRHGWALGTVTALPVSKAYTLFSADASARLDIASWAHKARTFFGTTIELCQQKAYPNGETPETDAVFVELSRPGNPTATRLLVVTLPLARVPDLRMWGERAADAIGGAGMDVLVAKAKRVWQVSNEITAGDDVRAPLTVAAIVASVLLAPIVPPEGGTIFGVKGARERIERSLRERSNVSSSLKPS